MTTAIGIGADQSKWTYAAPTSSTAALLDEAAYAYQSSLSSNSPTTGYNLIALAAANTLALSFYGKGASLTIATARIWGISDVPGSGVADDYMGTYLGTVSVVLGATQASTGLFSGDTYNFADQTNATTDRTNTPPGIRVIGDKETGLAMLIFDTIGYSNIIVQLSNIVNGVVGTPSTKVGLLWRVF